MSRDVSVEWRDDGEVIVTKHRDTEEARGTIEAIRRLVEGINKNSDEYTEGAYGEHEDAEHDQGDDDAEDADEELSPRERARRDRKLIANARETARQTSTAKRNLPMIDPDVMIEQVNKAGLGLAMVKRFAEMGRDELTEHQVTALLLGAWGVEFGKRFQAQDAEGVMARAAVAKARDGAWFKPTATETGERALAATSQPCGEKADPLRERIIRDKAVGSPFLDQEALERYADEMMEHLNGLARGKQERTRPGTLERA
jgi:hypothetical protein